MPAAFYFLFSQIPGFRVLKDGLGLRWSMKFESGLGRRWWRHWKSARWQAIDCIILVLRVKIVYAWCLIELNWCEKVTAPLRLAFAVTKPIYLLFRCESERLTDSARVCVLFILNSTAKVYLSSADSFTETAQKSLKAKNDFIRWKALFPTIFSVCLCAESWQEEPQQFLATLWVGRLKCWLEAGRYWIGV